MKSRLLVVSLAASVIVGIPAALRAQTAPAAAARTVTPVPPAPLDAVTLEKKIDELVGGHMKTNGFGGAVLLAKEGKPLVAKGYGYANIEWQIPNTTSTKFRIGSITKQFTSMLVMQLREQGKIKLEDSMCVYVAPCPEALEGRHHPSSADPHVRHPDLHRHPRLARGQYDAEDDGSDHRVLPRFAAAVDAGRQVTRTTTPATSSSA